MSARPSSPLEGVTHVVVDGTNLLYRLGRGTGAAAPPAAAIGRMRAAFPGTVAIDLVFDGMGAGPKGRVAQAMYVRWSGRRPADDTILELAGAGGGPGVPAPAGVLVVTDDRELRERLRAHGVGTVALAWLTARLELPRLRSPAPGNARPATGIGQGAPPPVQDGGEGLREGWRPGRGATAKRGPSHKLPRHRRHPRHGAG